MGPTGPLPAGIDWESGDTLRGAPGLLMQAIVHAADVRDRDGRACSEPFRS